jgi:hypothetical protein
VSALEKAPNFEPGTSEPAVEAGIFLIDTYSLNPGASPPLTEVVSRIQELAIKGRLIAQRALPGEVTVYFSPES